ncbi:type II toxin-antitoxin system PemK/MazF family toxin [Corallococcus sp. H22C18031201]|uniref:type II toxin-antitoxin system PemK/MazF family toxin n=1 Tax=Citreicoccus inhibens TaxID=2849499 RepID=UPI000E716E1D|nr:type II toxin-antitoxin system PemK/MazF family toxin [Citreicoccus inhibens]MBU8894015.1 type II toxin-antitoxin system PemK/MazF family toxin [Citreicoccus inhibens]RJS23261.1 type II toxin-antitoxin system PemK/MazF family toxin [Corallococcus sp. H22C18031201]
MRRNGREEPTLSAERVPGDIFRGDVFWVESDETRGSIPGIAHPHVVIQDDVLNHSRIHSVVVCALTSNLKRASEPGNVLLEPGEANLPKPSVVVVSQVSAIDKAQLGAYIGSLSEPRVEQIFAGMRFLQAAFFGRR